MKTIFTLLLLAVFGIGLNAQFLTVDFETPEDDTLWTQFANAGDAAENFTLVVNPDKTGINTSDNCIKFIVLDNADPWVGAWSDVGNINITSENYMLHMMVYKDVVSPVGMKVEGGGDPIELKVANTTTGAWELISFDFTAAIGATWTRLVVFPDFPETRTAGSLAYLDNFEFPGTPTSVREVKGLYMSVYPNPTTDMITIQYPGMKSITISNMVGQRVKVLSDVSDYIQSVEVSDLESGVYFVILETENGPVSSKFVKR